MTAQFWGTRVRYSAKCPSIGICLMFFWWWDWGYGFWGGRLHRYSALLTTSQQGHMPSTGLITDHLASVCQVFPRLSYFSSLFILYSGRKSPCTTHTCATYVIWAQNVATYFSSIRYLKFFRMGDLSILSNLCIYLFNHLFLSVWAHIYFQVWVIIQCYLIFCSNYSRFGHWEFLQWALLSLSHTQPLCFIFVFLSTFFLCVAQDAPSSSCIFTAPFLLEPRSGH